MSTNRFLTFHLRRFPAPVILDLVDAFALGLGFLGGRPRPFGAIRYAITARLIDGAAVPFDPPLAPTIVRNTSGYGLFFGVVRPTRSHGGRLLPGQYLLRIEGDYYQPEELTIAIPDESGAALPPALTPLRPNHAYPFPPGAMVVRGRRVGPDGTGEAGVVVTGSGGERYVTDASGEFVLVLAEGTVPGPVALTFTPPSGPAEVVTATAEPASGATALRGSTVDADGLPIRAEVVVEGLAPTVVARPDGVYRYVFTSAPPKRANVVASAPGRLPVRAEAIEVTLGGTTPVPILRFLRP